MLLAEVGREGIISDGGDPKDKKKELSKERKNRYLQNKLHPVFYKETIDARDKENSWSWLMKGYLKKETERFILAAQDQCFPTRNYQANILHNGADPKCRLCDEKIETIDHITSGYSKLATTEYVSRHDRIGQYLHWNICCHYEIPDPNNWYEHHPK